MILSADCSRPDPAISPESVRAQNLSQEDSTALKLPSGTACTMSRTQEVIHLQVLLLLLAQPLLERLQLLLHCPLPEALSSF